VRWEKTVYGTARPGDVVHNTQACRLFRERPAATIASVYASVRVVGRCQGLVIAADDACLLLLMDDGLWWTWQVTFMESFEPSSRV